MKKLKLTALLVTMAMTASLAGCGNSASEEMTDGTQSSQATATQEAAGTETAENHDPVTLRFMWWGGDERAQATLDVIDKFEQEYPWITIEAEYGSSDGYQEKLTAQLVSGTVADIFQMGTGWMPGYVESNAGYFADFKDFSDVFDLSTFEESILKNNGQFDGHQYGVPTGISGHALIYNKKVADEIGVDFSSDYTWDDIVEMGKKVKEYDKDMYLLHHEEIESLAKNIPEAKRIRFFMTFGQSYLDHMRCLEDVGMLSTTPVNFNGQEIVPIQFLKALLPDPASLGPRTKGKTNIGCIFTGKKDGKDKTYYIYNVCDHQECYKEVGSQAISYTTGVPAMCGALMLLTGKWTTKGVHTVEEFDPDPYLDALDKYGLPRSESHNPALVD